MVLNDSGTGYFRVMRLFIAAGNNKVRSNQILSNPMAFMLLLLKNDIISNAIENQKLTYNKLLSMYGTNVLLIEMRSKIAANAYNKNNTVVTKTYGTDIFINRYFLLLIFCDRTSDHVPSSFSSLYKLKDKVIMTN